MEYKRCSKCGEVKEVTEFTPYGNGGYRAKCKTCRSKIEYRQKLERNLKSKPLLYFKCENNNCNYIWNRRKGFACKKCGCFAFIEAA